MPSSSPTPIALIGAGLVGASWAVVYARAGLPVRVFDVQAAQRDRALQQVEEWLGMLATQGLLQEPPAQVLARVSSSADLAEALDGCGYVQESIIESLRAKQALFETLDRIAAPDAILASSTSSFPTSAMAAALPGRARCVVVHPVNPPHLIPFVEVSGAEFTDGGVIERAMALQRQVGQSPIHVRHEVEGFVLNRLQWSLLAEACRLVADGVVGIEDIDAAIKDGLGRRWAFMGPFEVGDLNAPGGLGDYLTRFGPTIQGIATSRGAAPLPLTETFVSAADDACRAQWSQDEREARLARRDERLLALAVLLQ